MYCNWRASVGAEGQTHSSVGCAGWLERDALAGGRQGPRGCQPAVGQQHTAWLNWLPFPAANCAARWGPSRNSGSVRARLSPHLTARLRHRRTRSRGSTISTAGGSTGGSSAGAAGGGWPGGVEACQVAGKRRPLGAGDGAHLRSHGRFKLRQLPHGHPAAGGQLAGGVLQGTCSCGCCCLLFPCSLLSVLAVKQAHWLLPKPKACQPMVQPPVAPPNPLA